jgi:hypothetical protein
MTLTEPIDQIADDLDLDLELFPKQRIAWECRDRANEQLFGGAKGGGKSGLMRIESILLACQAPGLQTALFRRHYPELVNNHMEGVMSYPDILAKMVRRGSVAISSHNIRFLFNGSRISLNHMQHEKDVHKYQGREIHMMMFDEATQFTEAMYRYMAYTVLRLGKWRPPSGMDKIFPRVLNGANPGGPGHVFFKESFVDNGPYRIVKASKDNGGMNRQFIPSLAEDNPALLTNDPEYLDRLEAAGDPSLVRALREGDWNVIAGAMFGSVWRRVTPDGRPWHVRDPFDVPVGWPLWRSADDGFAEPFACYWNTRHPDSGTRYVISEIYRKGMTAPEVAEAVKERDLLIPLVDAHGNEYYNNRVLEGRLDSNAFAVTGAAELSRGEQMNRLGCRWKPVEKWPGSRVSRVQNFHKLLRPNPKARNNEPGIVFFNTCVNAIKTIPAIMRDEKKPEDVSDKSVLHAFDGVTYAEDYVQTKAGRIRLGGL